MGRKYTKRELIQIILGSEEDFENVEEDIIHTLVNEIVSKDVHQAHKDKLSFGDKMSDKMAEFAGSWVFIICFALSIVLWIILNIYLLTKPFDPYPFILLNLVLSCVAAIQAPIIMMSQNRQEEKDRIRSKNDYKVNLKAELIIEDLHYKIDKLLQNQVSISNRLDELEKLYNRKINEK